MATHSCDSSRQWCHSAPLLLLASPLILLQLSRSAATALLTPPSIARTSALTRSHSPYFTTTSLCRSHSCASLKSTNYGNDTSKIWKRPQRQYPTNLFSLPDDDTTTTSMQEEEQTKQYLKEELTKYLQLREQAVASGEPSKTTNFDSNKKKKDKIGGTRGNVILNYLSVVPDEIPAVLEEEDSDGVAEEVEEEDLSLSTSSSYKAKYGTTRPFDYEELTSYGYRSLIDPIMKTLGGRRGAYELMNMSPPPVPRRLRSKKKSSSEDEEDVVIIDREGRNDPARYQGLKMTQVLSDKDMGRALEEMRLQKQQQQVEGEEQDNSKPKKKQLIEETYVQPYADLPSSRKRPPSYQPDWTPEMLDEEGRKRGQAMAWAAKSKRGEFRKDLIDPEERWAWNDVPARIYTVCTVVSLALGFGQSTASLVSGGGEYNGVLEQVVRGVVEPMQFLAVFTVLGAVGSAVVAGLILAPEKNRSSSIWAVRGLLGGPTALVKLRSLESVVAARKEEDLVE